MEIWRRSRSSAPSLRNKFAQPGIVVQHQAKSDGEQIEEAVVAGEEDAGLEHDDNQAGKLP